MRFQGEEVTPLSSTLVVTRDGMIRDTADVPVHDFDGLSLRALLDCMRQSSWDWPSAMFALGGLDSDDEPTMYPGDRELAWLRSICPEENWEEFETGWDT